MPSLYIEDFYRDVKISLNAFEKYSKLSSQILDILIKYPADDENSPVESFNETLEVLKRASIYAEYGIIFDEMKRQVKQILDDYVQSLELAGDLIQSMSDSVDDKTKQSISSIIKSEIIKFDELTKRNYTIGIDNLNNVCYYFIQYNATDKHKMICNVVRDTLMKVRDKTVEYFNDIKIDFKLNDDGIAVPLYK